MMTVKMYKGGRYGRLTIICGEPYRFKWTTNLCYRCMCDCGRSIFAEGSKLRKGRVMSCGCLQKESQNKNLSHKSGRLILKLKIKDRIEYEIHAD
ncbi:HNH endonuclease [Vibrio phage F89 g1]